MRRTASLPLPLLLTALLLAGCTDPSPMPTPPPTPSQTPVFASDEEALAAAEEAYGKFLSASDSVLSNGGHYDDELKAMATDAVIAKEMASFETFRTNGWHLVGSSAFEMTLQRYEPDTIVTYSCDDIASTDVLDDSGASVVSADRPTRVPFEVTFEIQGAALLIADRTRWDGGGVC